MRFECDLFVRHQDPGEHLGVVARYPSGPVHRRELSSFAVGVRLYLLALNADLMFDQLVVGADRDELTRGHRECPGEETSDTSEANSSHSRVRTGHTEHERDVRQE